VQDDAAQQSEEPAAVAARLHAEAQDHYDHGEYADARARFERALALRRAALGEDALPTAETLGALALVLAAQGDPVGAQPMIERVLVLRERALGPDHPDTAEAVNNLGAIRRMRGDKDAARRLYERALASRERALGPDGPRIATSLSNLGVVVAAQRDYSLARQYHERALAIYERAVGPDARETGRALNNLAAVLADQGDADAAMPLLERSLAIHERTLGPRHPSVANVLINLGDLQYGRNDFATARTLYARALVICERTSGAAHPLTVRAVEKLLGALSMLREFELALPLRRIAQSLKQVPGHPDAATIEALRDFVGRFQSQLERAPLSPGDKAALDEAAHLQRQANELLLRQDFIGAQAAVERALNLREGVLGPDDFELAPLLRQLGAALQGQGEYDRLLPLQERIVAIHASALGEDHPMSLATRAQLLGMRSEDEGRAATLPEMEEMLAALKRQVAPDQPLASTIQDVSALFDRLRALQQVQPPVSPPPEVAAVPNAVAIALLAGLDDVPWRSLHHAYGPASDVPGQLRALLSPDEVARQRALHQLSGNILHQGTVYEATAYAVPFLIKLVAYPGTPDRAAILYLLVAIAGDAATNDPAEMAAHAAVSAGLPLYLSLLDPAQDQGLRAAASATLAAFPERASESVPPLQAALAAERDAEVRLWLVWALAQVMDASEQAQTYFADMMARADDPNLAFLAAAALTGRVGEATPSRAVETLVEAVGRPGTAGPDGESSELEDAMESVGFEQWPGTVEVAVERLAQLGPELAQPALLRAFQSTHDGDAARTVAQGLLGLKFNTGRPLSKATMLVRQPDGHRRVMYRKTTQQPERTAASLTPSQRAVLVALAAHDPFWEQDHDLLTLYGLPATREALSAFLAER
jgi:tetratricopeptide (TPR) repeat protein